MLERYITPYLFAITDCHVKGDLCWYPGQSTTSRTPSSRASLCDLYTCQPVQLPSPVDGKMDYPLDEYTLAQAFGGRNNSVVAEAWINSHLQNFITKEDVQAIAEAGITHLRVPLPHWILGEQYFFGDELWIVGQRWEYFLQLCQWAREFHLQLWPDIHTAPGSQNGFDNGGRSSRNITCTGWSKHPSHVQHSLNVIRDITAAIRDLGFHDVVTGFGLLNEPFKDCNPTVYRQFLDDGLDIVRLYLGPKAHVYVGDLFSAPQFNDGQWWLDADRYYNTYLDSHYYHVFAQPTRALSPRQHIALVCQNEFRDAISCCYQNPWRPPQFLWMGGHSTNAKPSQGVKRIVGEWSAAADSLPVSLLDQIMQSIAQTGIAYQLDRTLSPARMDFLKHFIQAQMVAYEAKDVGTSQGWFYWTAKMEGGAFAEWDFLRGVREGWMPPIVSPNQTSQDMFGSCYDIIFRTNDDDDILAEFPRKEDLPPNAWIGPPIDDDVVVSHGDSLLSVNGEWVEPIPPHRSYFSTLMAAVGVVAFALALRYFWQGRRSQKHKYTPLNEISAISV